MHVCVCVCCYKQCTGFDTELAKILEPHFLTRVMFIYNSRMLTLAL